MNIECIIVSPPQYTSDGKIEISIAVTMEQPINNDHPTLRLTENGQQERTVSGTVQQEFVDNKTIVFELKELNSAVQYKYSVLGSDGNSLKILAAEGQDQSSEAKDFNLLMPPLPAAANQRPFTFAIGGDQEAIEWRKVGSKTVPGYDRRTTTARLFKHMAEKTVPQFFIHLGDTMYGEGIFKKSLKTKKDFLTGIKSDFFATVRGSLGSIPSSRVLDDHDLGHNGADSKYYQGKGKSAIKNALGVFNSVWPLQVKSQGTTGERKGLYYKLSWGAVEIWYLHNRIYDKRREEKVDGKNRTVHELLGGDQKKWLEESLCDSSKDPHVKLRFIVTPLPFVLGKNPKEDYRHVHEIKHKRAITYSTEWKEVLTLFARYRVNAIFTADSHFYSRADIKVPSESGSVVIPQLLVGTLGGPAQKLDEKEKGKLPDALVPTDGKRQRIGNAGDFQATARAYYRAGQRSGHQWSARSEETKTQIGKKRYGYMVVDCDPQQETFTVRLNLTKHEGNGGVYYWDAVKYQAGSNGGAKAVECPEAEKDRWQESAIEGHLTNSSSSSEEGFDTDSDLSSIEITTP